MVRVQSWRPVRESKAYAGLADSYVLASFLSMASPAKSYGKAKAAATRALEIDQNLAEAHATLALILIWYEWDWPAGEAEFKRALELSPHYAIAHQGYGRPGDGREIC